MRRGATQKCRKPGGPDPILLGETHVLDLSSTCCAIQSLVLLFGGAAKAAVVSLAMFQDDIGITLDICMCGSLLRALRF